MLQNHIWNEIHILVELLQLISAHELNLKQLSNVKYNVS